MKNTAYRLAEYKVIENEHGDLWWETHIGLGSQKSGKCFINEDILFIKPSDSIGPGFLKGEFLDHLSKLPKWEKTKYYCASYKIHKCKSGSGKPIFDGSDRQGLNKAILLKNGLIQNEAIKTRRKSFKVDTVAHNCYRLRRHEIVEKDNGQFFWKSHGGPGRSTTGRCHIKGRILFLEPGETERSNLIKKEFRKQLNGLPDWERTKYFCVSYTIYDSKTGAICRSLAEDKAVNIAGTENIVVSHKTDGDGINITPTTVKKGDSKEKLIAFFNFCQRLVMLILKLLFGCFQIFYKAFRALIDRWARFRG
jgi:hypothetical protein